MAKPKVNYWVDVVIGAAFTVSAVSGLVFLLPLGLDTSRVLGLSYKVWDGVHLWASLAMIAGVLAHLVLHSKWIVCMTQKALGLETRRPARVSVACPVPAKASVVSRRRFLALGVSTLVAGAILAGGTAVLGAVARVIESVADDEAPEVSAPKLAPAKGGAKGDAVVEPGRSEVGSVEEAATSVPTEPAPPSDLASRDDALPTPETTGEAEAAIDPTATPAPVVEMCVSCPRGLVNDPYPGRCRLYVDRDNDGLCDHSVPTPCG